MNKRKENTNKAPYTLTQAEKKYKRLLALKKELDIAPQINQSKKLCQLLGSISNNFFNEFIESEANKAKELNLLKEELSRQIVFLKNNNQKDIAKKYQVAIKGVRESKKEVKTTAVKRKPRRRKIYSDIRIGSILEFGKYPFDEKETMLPIKWQVLDIKEERALLITIDNIDCKKYNETYAEATWEKCTLRKWLNNNFYYKNFSVDERLQIATSVVVAHKNPWHNTNQGNNTNDKIFLLSTLEVERYFWRENSKKSMPTGYARKNGALTANNYLLRTNGYSCQSACEVIGDRIDFNGASVSCNNIAIRPALWLNLCNVWGN